MNSNLPKDLFSKCNQLKFINLQTNDFSFDQIIDINERLLSPLRNLSYLKIDEENFECPELANTTCSNCTMVQKVNSLFEIAKDSDIQCRKNGRKLSRNNKDNIHETKKIFSEALHKCQTCREIESKNFEISSMNISAGKFWF